jgi:hypothetical protein
VPLTEEQVQRSMATTPSEPITQQQFMQQVRSNEKRKSTSITKDDLFSSLGMKQRNRKISFTGTKEKKLHFPCALSSNQTAIKSICSHASITVLGQKGETIIDENGRRSKEILPDKIIFQDGINLLHHKNCDDILELVRQALVPYCNKVVAELEKMDIYREKLKGAC